MSNVCWLKPVSIFTSLVLTLLSLCGVLVYITPDILVPDGFLVTAVYTIPVIVCSSIGKHRAAIVLGSGGIMAAIATWLLLLLVSRSQFLSWDGKTVTFVALGIPFICSLLGVAVSFMIMRGFQNKR